MLERRGDRVYLYRYKKVGGRSRRLYVAAGQAAERAALEDAARRAERSALAQAVRAEEVRQASADARLDEFIRLTDALARAALMAAGFFRHDRGQWRRRRDMSTATQTTGPTPTKPTAPPGPPPASGPQQQPELEQLVRRAEAGDREVLPALRQALDAHPEVWQNYCRLGEATQLTWLGLMAGDDLMLLESWRRQVEALKAEVAGDDPAPLERLLAGRVGACWLQVQVADTACVAGHQGRLPDDPALLRRQNAAHRRLLQAVKTLAVVRRLLRPAVSPVAIATRLGRDGPAATRARRNVSRGAGAEN